MAPNTRDALPVETIRDLLAIARQLYRLAMKDARIQAAESYRLAGEDLREALRLARSKPGSGAHRMAWMLAERGTAELSRVVRREPTLKRVVLDAKHELGFDFVIRDEREQRKRYRH